MAGVADAAKGAASAVGNNLGTILMLTAVFGGVCYALTPATALAAAPTAAAKAKVVLSSASNIPGAVDSFFHTLV